MCRGGAGSPIEGKQKAFVPPPAGRAGRVPRESFRGKCRIPLPQVLRQGAGCVTPPRNASPAFGRLRRPPAALRAAPRAGASPVLQTSPRGTAPPRLPELSVTRFARVRFSALPRYNHRAPRPRKLSFSRLRAGAAQSFSTIQSSRGTRNKRQSPFAAQTSRFNVPASACDGVSATFSIPRNERSSRPDIHPPVGAGGVSPKGQRPYGRTFRSFSLAKTVSTSSGKVSPARGAQRKKLLQIIRRTQSFQFIFSHPHELK